MSLEGSLLDGIGIRDARTNYVRAPSTRYGLLVGDVHGKTNWKKFIRYLVTSNPDLFHNVTGYLCSFDRYANELAAKVRLTFGHGGEVYSMSRYDGEKLLSIPVMSLSAKHSDSFTLYSIRTAINRLLVMVRKATMPVVASSLGIALPELTDSQLLADMRSQCRAHSALGCAPTVIIHDGKLVCLRVNQHDVRMVLAGLQRAYPGEFDGGIRLLGESSSLPAWVLYDLDVAAPIEGGCLRFANYDYNQSKCSEFQFIAQQAVLRAGGCSPENICAKTIDLINTLIKQEN